MIHGQSSGAGFINYVYCSAFALSSGSGGQISQNAHYRPGKMCRCTDWSRSDVQVYLWDFASGMPGRSQDRRSKSRSPTASQIDLPTSNHYQPTEHTVLKLSSSQGFWFLPTLNQPPTLHSSNANNHIGRLPPAVSPLPEESSCYSGRYVAQHTYVMRATGCYKHGIRTTRPT